MKIAQLETFVVVAEELHFRRAAERLYTQPSTVSTHISQLETEYGTPLFIRNSRNVTLSPAGETLLEKAKITLASIADLEHTAKSLAAGEGITLTVGTMDEALAELTRVVHTNYLNRFPNGLLTPAPVDYSDLSRTLLDGRIDVCLTTLAAPWFRDASVISTPLFAETRAAVLPISHRLADRSEIAAEELLDSPFLAIGAVPQEVNDWYQLTGLREQSRSRDVLVHADHMHHVLNQVAWGFGLITVTRGTERFYPRPDVVYVPVTDIEPGVLFVTRRADEARPHVLAYIEECINAVNTSLDLIPTATNATNATGRRS